MTVAQGEHGVVPDPRGGAPRLAWVDATRGYSVAAVVLFHVVLWHFRAFEGSADGFGFSVWSWVNGVLGSVRMPVLLAVSGLVLARRVRSGPQGDPMVGRALGNYYLYLVWLAVYVLFYRVVTTEGLPHRVDGVLATIAQVVLPATTLWYLFALALFSVVLSAAHRVAPWIVLLALGLLSATVHTLGYPGLLWPRIPEVFFFFALGVYGAERLRRLAEGASFLRVAAFGVLAAGVTAMGRFSGGRVTDSLVFVARGTAFMVFAVVTVGLLVRWSPLRRLGSALGRQTLGVYVLHPLWIALLIVVTDGPFRGAVESALGHPVVSLLYPPVVTALIIAVSMPARRLAEKVRLGRLFQMPSEWRGAVDRGRSASARPVARQSSPDGAPSPRPAAARGPVAAELEQEESP